MSQAEAAAVLSHHVLQFREGLVTETMEPERLGPQKLCMYQYVRAFNSCRVPGVEVDEVVTYGPQRHIVVLYNNAIYTFDVLAADGSIKPVAELLTCVRDAVATLHALL